MSSLAASRADNFYYPPEWRPEYGGISKFQGSKGKNQYEQKGVIRFELPYDGWCLGCNRHLGKGVRFNAKKDAVGNYFSTKIYQFTMTCPSCSHQFIIRTDPKNRDYEFVEGIRKKEESFTSADNETIDISDEKRDEIRSHAIMRLEKTQEDKRKAQVNKERLERLIDVQEVAAGDNYTANSILRQAMRARKKSQKALEQESESKGLGITLLPSDYADAERDAKAARSVQYQSKHAGFKISQKKKAAAVQAESIFGGRGSAPTSKVQLAQKRALLLHRGVKVARPLSASASVQPSNGPNVVVKRKITSSEGGSKKLRAAP